MGLFLNCLVFAACILIVNGEVLTYGDGSVHGDFNVYCSDTKIEVYFNKTNLDMRNNGNNNRNYTISWVNQDLPSCSVTEYNSSFVDLSGFNKAGSKTMFDKTIWIEANFNPLSCGLVEMQNSDYIYYNSTVRITYGQNTGIIRREEYDFYHVSCLRNRTVEQKLTGDYFNTSYRVNGTDKKNNRIDYSIALTHSDMNNIAKTEYKLGDYIKFGLTTSTATNVKAVIQKCWSTSDGAANEYKLIDSRCSSDPGTFLMTQTALSTQWKTEAFRYLNPVPNSQIYVECLVRVCTATSSDSECTFCPSRKRRDVTEETSSSSGEMAVVRSPIFYIIEKDQPTETSQSSASALSGTNGTIVIVLLASLVFIVAIAVIKKVFFTGVIAAPVVSMKGIDNQGLA